VKFGSKGFSRNLTGWRVKTFGFYTAIRLKLKRVTVESFHLFLSLAR